MHDVLAQVATSTRRVCDALVATDLDAPSELSGWNRLTIACHLRYGAEAMRWMTLDAVAGRPTSYYPEGRAAQRPGTLLPRGNEDVVASLRQTSTALDEVWAAVADWDTEIVEPPDNADLGPLPLAHLSLFRLTEIEVHGTDLGIGLPEWSDVLIEHATPVRLARLQQRTPQAPGAWVVNGVRVGDASEPEVLELSDRDAFALTLGRIELSPSFQRAFPGP